MPPVTVVNASEVTPRRNDQTGLIVRPTVGPHTGFDGLEQAVLECLPGRTELISVGEVEETLFVLEGEGELQTKGKTYALGPDVGVYLPRESKFTLECHGERPLRLVAVRVPDPSPGPPAPVLVRRVDEAVAQDATTNREFRILADPESGLRSATHFVGYVPSDRAPDHFHTYDEVIYVLEGQGVMRAGNFSAPVGPGACIQLPARTVHCLENTGATPMRLVAVFRPGGSPANAFYPDGTPAYSGPTPGGGVSP